MLSVNQVIPDFEVKDIYENVINNEVLTGKYTILFFFPNTFKPTCTKECEIISEYYEEFKKICAEDFLLIGVADVSNEELKKFVEENKFKGIYISDQKKELSNKFVITVEKNKIKRSTFILDRWTRIRHSYYDIVKEDLENHLKNLKESFKLIVKSDNSLDSNIEIRRSKRGYLDKKLDEEKIYKLFEAAHLAPSCFNNQPWKYILISDEKILEEIYENIPEGNYWIKYAPTIVAVYSNKEDDCDLSNGREYFMFDTGMSVGLLMIQAAKMGILTHAIAGFKPKKIKKILDIPEKSVLITLISIGYPGSSEKLSEDHKKTEKSPRDRKDLSTVLKIYK